jgi:hypothetical protein
MDSNNINNVIVVLIEIVVAGSFLFIFLECLVRWQRGESIGQIAQMVLVGDEG